MNFGSSYTIIGNRNGWLLRMRKGATVPDGFAVIDACNNADNEALPPYWALYRYESDVLCASRHGVVDTSKPCSWKHERYVRDAIVRCCDAQNVPPPAVTWDTLGTIGLDGSAKEVVNDVQTR